MACGLPAWTSRPRSQAMPDFDWSAEAAKRVLVGDPGIRKLWSPFSTNAYIGSGEVGERITSLARRFHGRTVLTQPCWQTNTA